MTPRAGTQQARGGEKSVPCAWQGQLVTAACHPTPRRSLVFPTATLQVELELELNSNERCAMIDRYFGDRSPLHTFQIEKLGVFLTSEASGSPSPQEEPCPSMRMFKQEKVPLPTCEAHSPDSSFDFVTYLASAFLLLPSSHSGAKPPTADRSSLVSSSAWCATSFPRTPPDTD